MAGDDDLLAMLNVTVLACLLLLQRRRSQMRREDIWPICFGGTEILKDRPTYCFPVCVQGMKSGSEKLQKHWSKPAQRAEYLQRFTFNYRLSHARRLIENAFGIMSRRWRILCRAFMASENTTENVIQACVVLHNFMLQESPHARLTYNPPGYVDHEDWQGSCMEGAWRDGDDDPSIFRKPTASGCHSAW
ncbi:hypothetical protein MRX96_006988 [Rhipicephalus microplus]